MALAFQAGAQVPAAAPAASSTEAPVADPAVTALALKIYQQMRAGKVDPALLSPEMQKGLTPAALAQSKPMFDQLGDPSKLTLEKKETVAQGTKWEYLATFAAAQFHVDIFVDTSGKVAGYFLKP
jgi:hypothetical protein